MLKINFLGDSITEGMLTTSPDKSFVNVVGQLLNCETRNYGIGGTRIAQQKLPTVNEPRWDEDFIGRVPSMDDDADFVFVFGGTNDYGHGDAPMGKLGDNTPYTFYGAVNYLVDELLKKYKKETIIFILPLYRVDENNPRGDGTKPYAGEPLSVYRKAMEEVLTMRGIEIFDIKEKVGKAENNSLIEDGLHPSDEGHKFIATLISEFVRQRL